MPQKKQGKKQAQEPVVCRNRKARHRYEILDTIEAGIVLAGSEVKSLRNGKASIEEAYARVKNGEVWLINAEIPEYPQAGPYNNHEPKRPRKLLLHRREIDKFAGQAAREGLTLVPLKIYFRRGYARVQLALARGRKLHDKRERIKRRTAEREMRRQLGRRR